MIPSTPGHPGIWIPWRSQSFEASPLCASAARFMMPPPQQAEGRPPSQEYVERRKGMGWFASRFGFPGPGSTVSGKESAWEIQKALSGLLSAFETAAVLRSYLGRLHFFGNCRSAPSHAQGGGNATGRIRRKLAKYSANKGDSRIDLPAIKSSNPSEWEKRGNASCSRTKHLVCKECGVMNSFSPPVSRNSTPSVASERAPALQGLPATLERGCRPWPQRVFHRHLRRLRQGGPECLLEPKSDRPVYCSECFAKMKEEQQARKRAATPILRCR